MFDDRALAAVLGTRPPSALSREGRIALLGRAARALLDGKVPDAEARLFLGGAVLSWLREGGNLERDFFKVIRPKSHVTVQRVWARIEAHPDDGESPDEPL